MTHSTAIKKRAKFSTQLVRQIGESLLVAELSRLGIIATPLAGNVPDIDILAYGTKQGKAIAIQVKTMSAGEISINVKDYLDMEFSGKRQIIRGKKSHLPHLIFVAIWLDDNPGTEHRYYICTKQDITDIVEQTHQNFLTRYGGIRPKNWRSPHSAISEIKLKKFRNKWDLILQKLGESS